MDIQGRVAVKKPLLRKQIVKKRLKFAREHLNWTPAQWRRVLWTDESKFELFGNKRHVLYAETPFLSVMLPLEDWSWYWLDSSYTQWSDSHNDRDIKNDPKHTAKIN